MYTCRASICSTTQCPRQFPEYAWRLQDRLESAHLFALEQQQRAGVRQKRNYDVKSKGRHFQAGELVWVFNPKRTKGRCPKLDSPWVGPRRVLERLGEVVYRLHLPPKGRRVVPGPMTVPGRRDPPLCISSQDFFLAKFKGVFSCPCGGLGKGGCHKCLTC